MMSNTLKKEIEKWFAVNYNGELDLNLIHNTVIKKRTQALDKLQKTDPLAHIKFMPIIESYKAEIKAKYSK